MDSKKEGQGAHCAKISSYCPDGAGEKEIATKMTLQPPVRGYATYKREASFDSVDEPPSWDEDGETVRTIDTMPVHYRASWDTTNEPPAWDDNGDTIRSIQSEYAFGEPNVVPASVGVGTPLVLATLVEHEEARGIDAVASEHEEARGIDAVASKSVRDFHEGSYDRIEISIKCRDLKNRDLISKSDPFCVVHLDEEEDQYNNSEDSDDDDGISSLRLSKKPSERSKKIGTTEVIKDNLNPDFTTTFVTNFIFEERQTLIVRVYDEDVKGDPDLSKHDYLGAAAVTLGKLMSSRGHIVKLPILGKGEKKLRGRGHMIIQAEKVASCNDQLIMTLAGSDLVKVGSKLRRSFGGKSDPFVVVSRKNPSGEYMSVWRSEVCYSTLHPTWSCRLPLQRVCNADLDRPILFEIFDWEKSGSHKDMGKVQTTVRRILDLPSFNIKHTKCNDSSAGTLKIQRAEIWKIPSMLEYTSGSCEINFMAAVDFSASNNFVKRFHRSESSGSNFLQQRYKLSSESLHFFSEVGFPNEYQAALSSIGSILSDYGCHRSAPLYAFGAKIDGHSDSIFVVPEIDANEGDHNMRRMLTSYKSAFSFPGLEMTEPTLLAPVIREAARNAKLMTIENEQAYSVLLVLTDGKIDDVDQTIDTLVEHAADAPLSIVIVGVGGGNFEDMMRLDGDEEAGGCLVSSEGKKCPRDLVQFVPFRKYSKTMSHLTAETLAEIPLQLVTYFMSKGIRPTPPDDATGTH